MTHHRTSGDPPKQEVRSGWRRNALILTGFWFLLPSPLDSAWACSSGPVNHRLRSLPHLLNIVSALCNGLAAGGGSVVRASQAHNGNKYSVEILPQGVYMCSKRGESVWVLDYICQSNEAEQKLSNVKLFKCILHLLNTVFTDDAVEAEFWWCSVITTQPIDEILRGTER